MQEGLGGRIMYEGLGRRVMQEGLGGRVMQEGLGGQVTLEGLGGLEDKLRFQITRTSSKNYQQPDRALTSVIAIDRRRVAAVSDG